MRTWAKRTTPAALLALGVMTLGGGTAFADTDGEHSVGGGNQLDLPISLPIDISGNAVGVAGESNAGSQGGASVEGSGGGAGGNSTSGRSSVLGGNQVVAPITAPINACGNAVSLFGEADAGCKGGASVKGGSGRGAGGNRTDGRSSVGGGNQVVAPITAPINVCGNAVSLFGEAFAGCKGGAEVTGGGGHYGGHSRGAGGNRTDGRFSVGGGNQVVAPITAPVNVCGNAIGNAEAECKGGAFAPGGGKGAGGNRTSGRSSVLGGNQVVAPITAPINVCGNAAAVLGDAAAGCLGGAHVGSKPGGHGHWGSKPGKYHTSGMLPALPVIPGQGDTQQAGTTAHKANGPALPVVGDVQGVANLPATGLQQATAPVTDLADSTPIADILPLEGAGLMSAAQPVGVTGMNSGSLLALVLGGLATISAAMFSVTRRARLGKK
ncbi:chaplin family protein [Planobispora rosea]|uniref:Chaplin domain-containing protein n=1 Tax=Planobispora rosea TaxID=35762 RepID=A0A8J3W9J7_PLARO|nr:chaplin family protein [Planobispora rosea]GIH81814.1 hypothetical protein Pro02_02220 [Planobispora rosea]